MTIWHVKRHIDASYMFSTRYTPSTFIRFDKKSGKYVHYILIGIHMSLRSLYDQICTYGKFGVKSVGIFPVKDITDN
jgi:hypothetical protein